MLTVLILGVLSKNWTKSLPYPPPPTSTTSSSRPPLTGSSATSSDRRAPSLSLCTTSTVSKVTFNARAAWLRASTRAGRLTERGYGIICLMRRNAWIYRPSGRKSYAHFTILIYSYLCYDLGIYESLVSTIHGYHEVYNVNTFAEYPLTIRSCFIELRNKKA